MKILLLNFSCLLFILTACSIPPGGLDKKRCSPGKSYSEITKECEETGAGQ